MSFLAARDFGSRTGGGGVASASQANVDRRERLRQLALETIDLQKDPYFMRNHLGTYECKLCLTLHANEGSYLAHTQGKRHQQNLARRAAREAANAPVQPQPLKVTKVATRRSAKIGRPGYKIIKERDPDTGAHCLLFTLYFPDIEEGFQPRHRIMSAYEQRREAADPKYQYLIVAAEPYETIAFKIPNRDIDKSEGRFFTHWDPDRLVFTLQLFFKNKTSDATATT